MRRLLPFVILAVLLALFLTGNALRGHFLQAEPISSIAAFQAALEALRTQIAALGWSAPAVFVLIVVLRYALLLPSALVLTLGGLLFGWVEGSLLSFVGILLSSLAQYGIGRFAGRELLTQLFGSRFERIDTVAQKIGPWIVGIGTAHPAGSMGIVHTAGGFAAMPMGEFLASVAITAPFRAGAYAVLGSSLVNMKWWVSLLLAAALLAVGCVPLLFPRLRAKILSGGRDNPESGFKNDQSSR